MDDIISKCAGISKTRCQGVARHLIPLGGEVFHFCDVCMCDADADAVRKTGLTVAELLARKDAKDAAGGRIGRG